jgi:signal peptide peptidase SppA
MNVETPTIKPESLAFYPNAILRRFACDVPLLAAGAITSLLPSVSVPQAAEHPTLKRLREIISPKAEVRNGIAIVPIEGVLAYRPDPFEMVFYGIEDSAALLDSFEQAAANPEVEGILLNINSPGGFMTGGPEIADAVKRVDKSKPVVARIGGIGASLAYWIASQAETIVASRSAVVGSIGAFTTFVDYSQMLAAAGIKVEVIRNQEGKFKAVGVSGTSLNDEQRSHLQDRVQASFAEFLRAVKSARPQIQPDKMQGQTFTGTEAKVAGLVDKIGDLNFAMSVVRAASCARRHSWTVRLKCCAIGLPANSSHQLRINRF